MLTWTTYGTWLPGDERGFVSRIPDGRGGWVIHNTPGEPYDFDMPALRHMARRRQAGETVRLTAEQARVVAEAVREVADRHDVGIHACAIMDDHVHVVAMSEEADGARLLNLFKGVSSRRLGQAIGAPGPNAGVPKDATTTPGPNARVPKDATNAPGPTPRVPKDATTTPGPTPRVPKDATTTPGPNAGVPKDATNAPGVNGGVPKDATTTPGPNARVPKDATTTPGPNAGVPKDATTTPGPNARVPKDATTTPGPNARVPKDATTTPGVNAGARKSAGGRWWTEHGSRRMLPNDDAIRSAERYVENQPGALIVFSYAPGEGATTQASRSQTSEPRPSGRERPA
ncbi:MAG: hypothetical protein CHACPFDD_01328 [Phycisphaerae bacterium]|nr:hypothetical protein [Phycisphaerae bacterium]